MSIGGTVVVTFDFGTLVVVDVVLVFGLEVDTVVELASEIVVATRAATVEVVVIFVFFVALGIVEVVDVALAVGVRLIKTVVVEVVVVAI